MGLVEFPRRATALPRHELNRLNREELAKMLLENGADPRRQAGGGSVDGRREGRLDTLTSTMIHTDETRKRYEATVAYSMCCSLADSCVSVVSRSTCLRASFVWSGVRRHQAHHVDRRHHD